MDALGINGPFLLAQIINFLVIMMLLRMFLYEPVLNMLEERRQKISESLSAAETARAEAAAKTAENEKIIADARREGQKIINQAQKTAKRREVDILAQAQKEAAAIKKRANSEIEHKRQQAMTSVRDQVAQLSLAIARKTIGASLVDKRAHNRIVNEVLAEVGK